MPRPGRLETPGVPLHIVQRGNNRNACFFGDIDRRLYLRCLKDAAVTRGVAVNAYVLMTNHVHLLLTSAGHGSVAAVLQDVGRRYVRILNTVHERTGTLWEGRYKSSPITDERYLLACHQYIELNPVRAGMVADPVDYPWSSYRHYACGQANPLVTEHAGYLALGNSMAARCDAFRMLCVEAPGPGILKVIREAINANQAIGAEIRKRGRPKKVDAIGAEQPRSGNLF